MPKCLAQAKQMPQDERSGDDRGGGLNDTIGASDAPAPACSYAPRPPRRSRPRILPRGREWFLVAIMALAIAVIVVGVWLSLRCGVTTSGGK